MARYTKKELYRALKVLNNTLDPQQATFSLCASNGGYRVQSLDQGTYYGVRGSTLHTYRLVNGMTEGVLAAQRKAEPVDPGPKAHPEYADRILWHGYGDGALPSSNVETKRQRGGDLLVVSKAGDTYNCHPKVHKCGGPDSWGYRPGNEMDLIECAEGCYPIRWQLSEHELRQKGLLEGYFVEKQQADDTWAAETGAYRYPNEAEAQEALERDHGDTRLGHYRIARSG